MGADRIQSLLSGRWQLGEGDGVPLYNPATEHVIAQASTTGLDLGDALAHARQTGGPNMRRMTFAERGALLERMANAMHEAREALIESAIVNGGCTRSDAKFDLDGAALVLHHYAEIGRSLGDRRIILDGEGTPLGRSPRFWAQHMWVPRHGVAVLINAFNFPAWGFAEKAACALLAGMPVLNKPATPTAHTAWLMSKLFDEKADLPPGSYSFLAGEPGDLLDHVDAQDVVAFTGSATTARRLRAHPRIIDTAARLNVEADSINGAVLDVGIDVDSETYALFVREVVREMTQKTGQKCTATRRILVPSGLVDRVATDIGDQLGEVVIGNPKDSSVRMGPVASAAQREAVREGLAILTSEADCAWGEPDQPVKAVGVPSGKGYFVAPVLLRVRDATRAVAVHQHEVFGPVSTIVPYDTAEEAIALVTRAGGGLVASVYGNDRRFLEEVALGLAPYHGRIYIGSEKMASVALGAGAVAPQCVHGGPGRAGGGEELGGVRGIHHYMQRVAVQGARAYVERFTASKGD